MPINRLGPRPPVSSTGELGGSGSGTVAGSSFQGKHVSIAGQWQLADFLPAGVVQTSSHIFASAQGSVAARNIAVPSAKPNRQPTPNEYEKMRQINDYKEITAHDYEEMRQIHDYRDTPPSSDD